MESLDDVRQKQATPLYIRKREASLATPPPLPPSFDFHKRKYSSVKNMY